LCLAQALRQAGFDVHVYERDPTPHARRQGYRITLDNHGMSALERCLPQDLFRRLLRIFPLFRGVGHFRFTNQDLGEIFKLTFRPDSGDDLRAPRQADREMLRSLLLSGLEGRVDFGRAAVRASAGAGEAMLHFADGSSIGVSVVVGADGARSALRKHLLPECDPIDLGSGGDQWPLGARARRAFDRARAASRTAGCSRWARPAGGSSSPPASASQSPKTM
jgi:2-polyprenyl-6-methoxyphenol hydroxylase-like FAD-dependent oxidoreductase